MVSRPRLIEQLNAGLHRKLTLVSAPAGFGKTTLLSEWVHRRGAVTAPLQVTWLSLDEDDNDPARFLAYFIAALQMVEEDIGEGTLGALQSPQPPPIEAILTPLLNEIATIPDEFALILDDYHLIKAKPIHDALTFLLDHLPPPMRLVIATRQDPPLPLARLRGRGEMKEIRAGNLRFTEEEATAFLNQTMGLCQCRMTEEIVGRGCGRSLENCVVFGGMAELLIRHGKMRRMEKKDILEIKAAAAATGLANFIAETKLDENIGGALCSCCGCCCGALRTISQFNAPRLIAPPHFMPKVDLAKCTCCGQCAKVCPVGAAVVDLKGKLRQHLPARCIGCGLCAVACDEQRAIQMEPTPKYRQPPKSLLSTLWQIAPNYLRNAWSVWRRYR